MKIFYLLILCFLSISAGAQNMIKDTIEYARSLAWQKKFEDASTLLKAYSSLNSNQAGLQLLAQIQYWKQDFDGAKLTYQKALTLFPQASGIRFDYGKMLFESSDLRKANYELNEYEKTNKNSVEAYLMLAKIAMWNSRLNEADDYIKDVFKLQPDNAEARSILSTVNKYKQVRVRVGGSILSDDQPLNATRTEAEISAYQSRFFSPALKVEQTSYSALKKQTSQADLENIFHFGYGKTTIKLGAGLFKSDSYSSLDGILFLSQKLSHDLTVSSSFSESSYQYTLSSVNTPLTQTMFINSIDFNKKDIWLGKVSYLVQSFADNNSINTAFIWFLMPVINKNKVLFQAGISTSYATASFNTFTATGSPALLALKYPLYTQLPGIYVPYFTPKDQQVNSFLSSLTLKPGKFIRLNAKASMGLLSKTDYPFLMLVQNGNKYEVVKSFYRKDYKPIELEGSGLISLTKRLDLSLVYRYASLLYYTSNFASLNLTYSFGHE